MMRSLVVPSLLVAAAATAAPAPKPSAADKAPAKSRVVAASIFKDGHVLVRQEATLTPKDGEIVLDVLPTPVSGSYHPYVAAPARLAQVIAGSTLVSSPRLSQDLTELLAGNAGARVRVKELTGESYEAVLTGAPLPSELDSAGRKDVLQASFRSATLLLRTSAGQVLVPLHRIRSLSFVGPWVNRHTGSGRVTWRVRLRPGESRDLTYTWSVYRS
jgi:hypothetical protein